MLLRAWSSAFGLRRTRGGGAAGLLRYSSACSSAHRKHRHRRMALGGSPRVCRASCTYVHARDLSSIERIRCLPKGMPRFWADRGFVCAADHIQVSCLWFWSKRPLGTSPGAMPCPCYVCTPALRVLGAGRCRTIIELPGQYRRVGIVVHGAARSTGRTTPNGAAARPVR